MRVVILGAGGFLGSRLAARIAASAKLGDRRVDELLLFDVREPGMPPGASSCRVDRHCGDMRDLATLQALFAQQVDVIVHLAATLTMQSEQQFRLGMDTNVLAFIDLLEQCRAQAQRCGKLAQCLFASSIATFGGQLPPVVDDDTSQSPASSYGTHKAIAELLLADYSRHGFLDGRAMRLPIVVTHPGPPSGSVSDQVASLIREPMRGMPTVCRMDRDVPLAVASVDAVLDGFERLACLPRDKIESVRAINFPGLSVTPAQIVAAVAKHLPVDSAGSVAWQPDPQLQAIVQSWPKVFTSTRALSLGIVPDASAQALIQSFLRHEPPRS